MGWIEAGLWISVGVVAYTYFGYPLVLAALARPRNRHLAEGAIAPRVSLVISAYNEEEDIEEKLENSLALDYPREQLEILVASDGSDDRTNEIVERVGARDDAVRLVANPENRGKSSIQNEAVGQATGEVLVFSDATGLYVPDALRRLVEPLRDPRVGCVAGVVVDDNRRASGIGEANDTYFRYDGFLRAREGDLGILNGISGSIFAVRRDLYQPLHPMQADDLDTPLNVLRQGSSVVLAPGAISHERIASTFRGKVHQKIRVVIRSCTSILLFQRDLLNPIRYPLVSLSLYSHRLLRYVAPVLMLLVLLGTAVLSPSSPYGWMLALELAFLLVAAMGWLLYELDVRSRVFLIPFYFVLLNVAAGLGFVRFALGDRRSRWRPER